MIEKTFAHFLKLYLEGHEDANENFFNL
jgi:hypothetical protein